MLSWTEVDDLRANLRADERAQFDAELHDLAAESIRDAGNEAAYAALVDRWRRVTASRADLPTVRYPEVHRTGWRTRLSAPLH